MNVITAIGDEKINNELKKEKNIKVIGVDIQYQEGIFEMLEKKLEINYLILNIELIGNLNKYELIEKILKKDEKLKIIVILEKEDKKLIKYLILKNIKYILKNDKINIKKIKNILNNKKIIKIKNKKTINKKLIKIKNKKNNLKNIFKIEKIYKKNKFNINLKNNIKINNKKIKFLKNKIKNFLKNKNKINKKINKTKIIYIIGDKKVGKTIFTIIISKILNKKILIIAFNNNKEINIMLGIKNSKEDDLIKINKKIDLLKCNISSLKREDLIRNLEAYDYVFVDSSGLDLKARWKILTKITDYYILIVEANIIGINNSKIILNEILNRIEKNKIKILVNKNNLFSIKKNIIKFIFYKYKIIGKIKYKNKYNFLINNNFKFIDKKIKKDFLKIEGGIL